MARTWWTRPRRSLIVASCLLVATVLWAQERATHATPVGTIHEMALVPRGAFVMGKEGASEVLIAHEVFLDAFYVDVLEVTRGRYAAFLNDVGRHDGDNGEAWILLERVYETEPAFRLEEGQYLGVDDDQLPATAVSWFGAQAYCEWAGLRLPTEAEWEKAARGIDGRAYPWGEALDRTRANYGDDNGRFGHTDDSDGYAEAGPVGSYPLGASPYGILDMAGNIGEWVSDWYSPNYYPNSPYENPRGPHSSPIGSKISRGGSWATVAVRTWDRQTGAPSIPVSFVGFRCAADAGEGGADGRRSDHLGATQDIRGGVTRRGLSLDRMTE